MTIQPMWPTASTPSRSIGNILALCLSCLLLAACSGGGGGDNQQTDSDQDGFTVAQGDCNDNAAGQNPTAVEIAGNGIDEDCDGVDNLLVPDVAGEPQNTADNTLTTAGLVTGTVSEAFDPAIPAGNVIRQSPAAGTGQPPGSAIALVISKGPQPPAIPSVTLSLASESDTGAPGDGITATTPVTLKGNTEAGNQVDLHPDGDPATLLASTNAATDGSFSFNMPLLAGANPFQATATNAAGGQASASRTVIHIPCSLEPRHFQLHTNDAPGSGDPNSNYDPGSVDFLGQAVDLNPIPGTHIEAFFTDLDANGFGDLVLRTPGSSSIQVWLSDGSGILAAPVNYPIGAALFSALVVGNFIGDVQLDIAVATSDNNIEFLEGLGGGAFIPRNTPVIAIGSAVVRLAAADLDGDGDDDLLIATGNGVSVFQQDNDLLNNDLIANGDFSLGLSSWLTEVVGHTPNQTAGTVDVINGAAVLSENNSFRITLKQDYIIPDPPGNLTFDLLLAELDDPQGGIPDAFEVSLLDALSNSVVPTIDAAATAFLNFNPAGIRTLANGVSINGDRVTLDLSGTTPGTTVTLFFDLIGNPPDSGSSASIDNVDAGNTITLINSFSTTSLPGPFSTPGGIGSCDTDADNLADILIRDSGSNQVLIYGLDSGASFIRQQTIPLNGI